MPAKPYRILVVDDHAVVRRGMRALINSQPGMEVCCEAANGVEAMEQLKQTKPDLAVVDLTMPEMNGLDFTVAAREESPGLEVLVLSMHFSEQLAREVLRCGALGYVMKSDDDSELLAAVEHARHHRPFFTSRLAATMAQKFMDSPNSASADGEEGMAGVPLTSREIEVVQLLAAGKSNKEVATAMGVSTRTVESHRNHIMHKMNFTSFSELIRFAVRSGMVEP